MYQVLSGNERKVPDKCYDEVRRVAGAQEGRFLPSGECVRGGSRRGKVFGGGEDGAERGTLACGECRRRRLHVEWAAAIGLAIGLLAGSRVTARGGCRGNGTVPSAAWQTCESESRKVM